MEGTPSTDSPGSDGWGSGSRGGEDGTTSGRLAGIGDAPRLAAGSVGRDHIIGITRPSPAPEPEGARPVEMAMV